MHSFDRQTDRRTESFLIAIPRLHYMQRGKKSACGGVYARVYCILQYVYNVVVHVLYLICL